MNLELLYVGLKVRHPAYGVGVIKSIQEHAAEIRFDDGMRTLDPVASEIAPAEPQVTLNGMEMPLAQLLQQTVRATLDALGLEKPDTVVEQLGARWHQGRLVMHPADTALQPKEVPLEVFFHKIVMMRNNLRVLEQKINSHPHLSEADKIELQQYISRCYGSMTTFNLLFQRKEDQFISGLG